MSAADQKGDISGMVACDSRMDGVFLLQALLSSTLQFKKVLRNTQLLENARIFERMVYMYHFNCLGRVT